MYVSNWIYARIFDMLKPEQALTPKARQTRAALIAAALEIIGQDGNTRIQVVDVCAKAKVGRTSFYNYFESAEHLAEIVVQDVAASLRRKFNFDHRATARGLVRLEKCLLMILDFAVQEREIALVVTAVTDFPQNAAEIIAAEISKELENAPSLSPARQQVLVPFLTTATIALCHGLASGSLYKGHRQAFISALMKSCE